jgi:hypothetical protein
MDSSNDYLAKGLVNLVLKSVHKNVLARNYTPQISLSFYKHLGKQTRSAEGL